MGLDQSKCALLLCRCWGVCDVFVVKVVDGDCGSRGIMGFDQSKCALLLCICEVVPLIVAWGWGSGLSSSGGGFPGLMAGGGALA
jgi:hypothetical protein